MRREAHKVQSLSHPNIVRVIDCDRDGQRVFMTMEYLPGRSLQELLRASGPAGLPANDALRIIAAIGDALEHAHRNHIVHGDLKPANVIVTEQGGIKVIDFGVAKIVARADCVRGGGALPAAPPVRAPKAVTLRYASPETAAGEDPEASDDVYALACIAYEALSGRHAFGPRKAPDRIGSIDPALPPQMPMYQYMAIVRALATHRRHRTPTIRRFVDELLATHRRAAIERWLWALAAAVAMVGSAAYWTHAGRGHAPDPPSPRRLAAPGDGVRHGALS